MIVSSGLNTMEVVTLIKKKFNQLLSTSSYVIPLSKAYHSPKKLQLETAGVCNFRCKQCSLTNFGLPEGAGMLSYESFVKIVDQFKYLDRIEPYGLGESFLNKDLFRMIKYVKDKNKSIIVDITTNGSLINDDVAHKILEHDVDRINFSVDGAKAETYEKIRRGRTFAEITQNIQKLVEIRNKNGSKKPAIAISMVLMDDNLLEVEEYVLLGKSLGVNEVHIQDFNPIWDKDKKMLDLKIVREQISKGRKTAKENKVNFTFPERCLSGIDFLKWNPLKYKTKYVLTKVTHKIRFRNKLKPIQCPLPWSGSYITNKGEVTPCCMIPDAKVKSFGNVNNEEIGVIWNNQEFKEFRGKLASGQMPIQCRNCSLAKR